MGFLQGLLIGAVIGIVGVPITLFLINFVKNTRERRKIKRMIKEGKFLMPIDKKDYDVEAWKNQITYNPEELENLNQKIFKKSEVNNG